MTQGLSRILPQRNVGRWTWRLVWHRRITWVLWFPVVELNDMLERSHRLLGWDLTIFSLLIKWLRRRRLDLNCRSGALRRSESRGLRNLWLRAVSGPQGQQPWIGGHGEMPLMARKSAISLSIWSDGIGEVCYCSCTYFCWRLCSLRRFGGKFSAHSKAEIHWSHETSIVGIFVRPARRRLARTSVWRSLWVVRCKDWRHGCCRRKSHTFRSNQGSGS